MDEEKDKKIDEEKSEKSDYHHDHGLKVVLVVILGLILFCGVVGMAKIAFFRHSFGKVSASKDIEIQRGDFGRGMMSGQMISRRSGSGLVGKITKIDGDKIIIHKDSNNKDYTIVISEETQIRKDGDIAAKSDLATGQAISINGSSNSSGEIVARYIIIN